MTGSPSWWRRPGLWLERVWLAFVQLQVTRTNEVDEPLWPRRLTPRGAAMLAGGVLAIRRGWSYLRPDTEVASLTYIGALLPVEVLASLWIVVGALVIVLGPTKWWRWGIDALAYLHAAWGVSAYLTWFGGVSPRGDITGDLYLYTAGLLLVVKFMMNPPRRGSLPGAPLSAEPARVPARRGKGRSDG